MLFILALQHQQHLNLQKDDQIWSNQLLKESLQSQSNLIRDSLLREAKQMKRQIRRQERLNNYELEDERYNFNGNLLLDQDANNDEEVEDEENIIHLRNEPMEVNRHRNHNNSHHHKRSKSKGINNLKLLEESKISDKNLIKNDVKNCAICLENYKIGDTISYLPCFHSYHSKCIKKWLKGSKICPLCKKEVNFNNRNIPK